MFENLRLSLRSIGGKSYAGPFGQSDPMNGLQEAAKEGSDDDEYEHDSRFDNDSGVMTITLVVHRK